MSRGSEHPPLSVTNSVTGPGSGVVVQAGTIHLHLPAGSVPGTRLRAVLRQQELVDGLGDFKKNLTSDQLPFVSPGDDHPAHPRQLFVKLRASDERGVLLVGAAGIGKTRTAIEVGNEALQDGWRVLHVMPGDDRSTLEELIEHVVAEPSPVLVVIDYLNESQLDLAVLRHRLIPEARRNNITVAVLASVRPGWLRKTDRTGLHELFDEVELRQDDSFQRLVTENALRKLAPTAVRRLGMPRMMELSGRRPVIAMLVGREIERRVTAGVPLPETAALRSGSELSAWLESRLREDKLTVSGRADDFTPAQASSGLLAAAAAAAACPQALTEVTDAANACLAEAACATPRAEHVVSTLISFGWLERDNDVLAVAHDAVTDQLMESVLFPESSTSPDIARTQALLAGCLTDARTIGRFAVNLGRLANDLELAGRAGALTPVLDGWFTANASAMGQVLRLNSDVGGYALGAICASAPWSGSAVRCWDQVVVPWLGDFGASVDARHLLYRGLRYLPPDGALLLVPTALAWLRTHGRKREASYVLASLISQGDLPPEIVQKVFARTLRWLDRHPTAPDARFVLGSLLARSDLDPRDSARVVTATLTWLDRHATAPDARFVLGSLLARSDLDPRDSARVVTATLTWLDKHATNLDAQFVLRALLSGAYLDPWNSGQAVSAALAWLKRHPIHPDARYVLRPLLSRSDLDLRDSARAVTHALTWLKDHATSQDAQFVLRRLLSRSDLDPRDSARAVTHTFAWLEQRPTTQAARFVLRPLLLRPDLPPDAQQRALASTVAWLDKHATDQDAQFVLRPFLLRSNLGPGHREHAADRALAWLDEHATDRDAQFVLRPLLSRRELSPEQARRAMSYGLSWLDCHATAADARFVLQPLLFHPHLGPHETERAVSVATGWLELHPTGPDSQLVRSRLAELRGGAPSYRDWIDQPPLPQPSSVPAPDNPLLRYDLAIRTTHSPPTPPGLAAHEMEIPWPSLGEKSDVKSATVDALRASGLTLGDSAARIVFIAPPPALALGPYAAVAGFTHRWVDVYADGSVLELADHKPNVEGIGGVARPDSHLCWAQVGGPQVDGIPTVAFPPGPDEWPDETTAGVVRHAARLRMVPPDSTSTALRMLIKVAALRTRNASWRLPVLSTGDESIPVDKSTQGQGLDLEAIRLAAEQYRKGVVRAREMVEIVPVPQVSPFNQRIAEANATDPAALLRRLGAAPDDGSRWRCPRDQANHVLKVRGGGMIACKGCYPRAVGLVRLTMDTLRLTPDEAAAFIMNDSACIPAPGMAVTARVVGSLPDAYSCTVRDPVTGRTHAAVLPTREFQALNRSRPAWRLRTGDTVVALVLGPDDGALLVGPSALGGNVHVLSLTAAALVERVLPGFVPELTTGEVAIMGTARIPGARTRIAAAPTGSMNSVSGSFIGVGAERKEGFRRLLSGGMTNEEIEIVPYSSDQRTMLANALAYAEPTDMLIDGLRAVVAVPRQQFRGTIGRGGLNAQLAGQLTGLYVKIVPSGTDLRLAMESGFDDE